LGCQDDAILLLTVEVPEWVTGAIEVPGTISTDTSMLPRVPETTGVLRRIRRMWNDVVLDAQ
jgi:hypothetical protein